MKKLLWATATVAILAVGTATAGDLVYKPINTNNLVVKPSRAVANVASQAINLVGNTTAGSIESNGYIKTINNLFSRKIIVPHTQLGPSQLPSPNLFPSTQYKSYNTPVMPIVRLAKSRTKSDPQITQKTQISKPIEDRSS